MPADAGISGEDRLELVRSFAEQHFVAKKLVVQLALHRPHRPSPLAFATERCDPEFDDREGKR